MEPRRSCRPSGTKMAMEPVGPAAQWLLPLRRAPAVSPPSGSYRPRRPAAPTAPPGSRGLAAQWLLPPPPPRRSHRRLIAPAVPAEFPPSRRSRHLV
ncbi:Os02g0729500 [Oryza sativa Japonica Group]|uniref:Os02g0729500 protein n=1 Tax=Oryza sativa subsp. japonica TaxID=39947 RepID=A0A0P0VPC2_ORYSJ|nr:Os02g0729500 [Oryza sativa Japonica Group]